ncbi:MAG: HD domain-containing protein [Bacteroidales bacterium]|nr:HD domain-containing protein [Bacteroidales bacterium]
MNQARKNKKKIINDPVHGFVTLPSDFIFDLIEHPYFQRLRRIKQLGLTHYVYPGATHTRFQHTIGALHLMTLAIESLRSKEILITREEEEAVHIAILLHDIGHGPFSHALEESIIAGISHEHLSRLMMKKLNESHPGRLDMAIDIFKNSYPKKFLHQLVTSQLDMDRLDYIKRDSFYTGVTEGTIGTDRIIKMLNVYNDMLVVEKKGIYSVEKFLIARRLMYWQVYLHKTVIAAENLLVRMLKRAKLLADMKAELFCSPSLAYFLYNNINAGNLDKNLDKTIEAFIKLDDTDIISASKEWQYHSDKVLAHLAGNIVNRKLPSVRISEKPPEKAFISKLKSAILDRYKLTDEALPYLLSSGELSNNAFSSHEDMIQILSNEGIRDISEISDILNVPYLQHSEKKYFVCYPKECQP